MPQWDKPEEYAYCSGLDKEGWAWEFLRRNPDYCQDYLTAVEQQAVFQANRNNSVSNDSNPAACFSPKREAGESVARWRQRIIGNGGRPRVMAPSRFYAEKWELAGMVLDPAQDEIPKGSFKPSRPKPELITSLDDIETLDFSEPNSTQDASNDQQAKGHSSLIAFDLRYPLTPQITEARAILKKEQAAFSITSHKLATGKIRADELECLRALDADTQSDATREEKANILFGEKAGNQPGDIVDTYKNRLSRGRRLMDDYMNFLNSSKA